MRKSEETKKWARSGIPATNILISNGIKAFVVESFCVRESSTMPEELLDWDESMSVGVRALDDDHKKIVSIINRLYTAIRNGETETYLSDIFVELFRWLSEHYAREESLLQQTDYPHCVAHERDHEIHHRELEVLFFKYLTQEDGALAMDVLGMLCQWVLKHIRHHDMKYKEHLNTHGVF